MSRIEELVPREELEKAVATAVESIKTMTQGKNVAYAWSGGKDSIVLSSICRLAGVKECMFAHTDLEYPAFLEWCLNNKPEHCEVIHIPYDLDWLAEHENMMTGVRASESIQRLQYMSSLNLGRQGITGSNTIYPIYDWRDNDIWKYIRDNNLDIPDAYMWLYQCGVSRRALRISNFFGIDSLAGMRHIAETDPQLWARIEKREPNAYMTLLYWDSEMYKRSTRTRQKNEGDTGKDYKEMCRKLLFEDAAKHFTNPTTRNVAQQYKRCFTKIDGMARPRDYRKMYDALIAGDPKLRTLRALYQDVYGAYAEYAKKFRVQNGGENNG